MKILSGVLLLAAFEAAPLAADIPARYAVSLSGSDRRTVRIEAEFPVWDSLLIMQPGILVEHLPDGWATYVSDLVAKDATDLPIPLEYAGRARWKAVIASGERLAIQYMVHLNHDEKDWPFGLDEAAYVADDMIFAVTAALFIYANGQRSVSVRFDLPADWRLNASWREAPGERNTFSMDGTDALASSMVVMGRYFEKKVSVGNMVIVLALDYTLSPAAEEFSRLLRSVVEAYTDLFGGVTASEYLVVASRMEGNSGGGGAFVNGFSLILPEEATEGNRLWWGSMLGHEMLHHWLGVTNAALRPQQPELEYWFTEGFTDYFTQVVLARVGFVNTAGFLDGLERAYQRYLIQVGQISPREAGKRKGDMQSLIYGGGCLLAFALDVTIREETGGRKSLDDMMRQMYAEFGTTGTQFRYEDVVRIAGDLAGRNMQAFFDSYVRGTSKLPIEHYFRRAGIEQRTVFLSEKPPSQSGERTILSEIVRER